MGRILLITFQQALRSVALTLFPLSFIALFAWATAGSATGNTSDPIRAAIWLWLGGHLIPFELSSASGFTGGALSYLPIGATLFAWLALRSGFRRSSEFLGNHRAARTFIVFWYTAIATVAALLSQDSNIKPNLILTPIFVSLIAISATVNYSAASFERFKFLGYLFMALLGLILLTVSASLVIHFSVVKSLSVVIQPGIMGGLLLTLLQLLYLPNIALSGISYLFGFGFNLGLGTQISPTIFELNSLPAIPILGSLPTSKHPLALIAIVIPILAIALNQLLILISHKSLRARQVETLKTIVPILVPLFAVSYFAGGTLLTQDMSPVGISWWELASAVAALQLIISAIGIYIPATFSYVKLKWSGN
jgi:hypothetical protein